MMVLSMNTSVYLADLARVMLRAGTLTFGGGNPTSAALQKQVVDERHWITGTDFALAYTLSRITPGTNLFACCSAVGYLIRGWPGALTCLLIASVPSSAITALLTLAMDPLRNWTPANALIHGAIAVAIGLNLGSLWTLATPYLRTARLLRGIALIAAGFLLAYLLSPVWVLATCAALGYFWSDS
jgi:chromate transporter